MSDAYSTDFYAWAQEQAALLRAGRLNEADIANIAEEIESMGRGEKRELVNRLTVLLLHLLKWRFQPGFRSASWSSSIREQRIRLSSHMRDNPSLKDQARRGLCGSLRACGDRRGARDRPAGERVSREAAFRLRVGDGRGFLAGLADL